MSDTLATTPAAPSEHTALAGKMALNFPLGQGAFLTAAVRLLASGSDRPAAPGEWSDPVAATFRGGLVGCIDTRNPVRGLCECRTPPPAGVKPYPENFESRP